MMKSVSKLLILIMSIGIALTGCSFQVSIEDLDESLNTGVLPPGLGGDGGVGFREPAPVEMITEYPVDGLAVNFYSFVTTYNPTQEALGSSYRLQNQSNYEVRTLSSAEDVSSSSVAKPWYWYKALITYLNVSKLFTTQDGYKVLVSTPDNLVESGIIK